MDFGSAVLSLEQTDAPQTTLLSWGEVIPWSWSIWNDPRLADSEIISQLTAAWLCHIDTSPVQMRGSQPRNWQGVLLGALASNPRNAAVAVMQLMNNIAMFSPPRKSQGYSMWNVVVFRTCWAVARLVDPCCAWGIPAMPMLLRNVCYVFIECMAKGENLHAREAIIETLTRADAMELRHTLEGLQDDNGSQFFTRMDNAFIGLKRWVSRPSAVLFSQFALHAGIYNPLFQTVPLRPLRRQRHRLYDSLCAS
ncbi:hypothetical protein BC834DRAFT_1138 [Gloeopeniophorella convolvens]|nr:hypothetical protein BC834DRAFT_1138 [Gloeopeniophorella convolvens]